MDKASPLIVPASEYTNLDQFKPRRDNVACYGWQTPKKRQMLPREKQLSRSNEDQLKKLWQDTDRQLQQYRYPDQDDFKNAERQLGKGMWSGELVRRVLALNNKLWVEDSIAAKGCAAFYWVLDGAKKFTNASFEKGFVPEFSIIRTDTADLPVGIKYGWRTVLLRLVKTGALTMRQVIANFGDVEASDSRGKHWSMNVADFK